MRPCNRRRVKSNCARGAANSAADDDADQSDAAKPTAADDDADQSEPFGGDMTAICGAGQSAMTAAGEMTANNQSALRPWHQSPPAPSIANAPPPPSISAPPFPSSSSNQLASATSAGGVSANQRAASSSSSSSVYANASQSPVYAPLPDADADGDWLYTMRRSMQEVVPGLFLGPYAAAMKNQLSALKSHGITHIVCVRQDIEKQFIKPNFPGEFEYLIVELADNQRQNLISHLPRFRDFVDACLSRDARSANAAAPAADAADAAATDGESRSRGKVLVHGNNGTSRSAALVVAYVMETFGLSAKRAFNRVQQRRFCVQPNEAFMSQLEEFEPIYRARKERDFSAAAARPAAAAATKRGRDDEEDDDDDRMELG